jgi:hypothetical protein
MAPRQIVKRSNKALGALWCNRKLWREDMGIFYPNPFPKATSRAVIAMAIIIFLKHDPTIRCAIWPSS